MQTPADGYQEFANALWNRTIKLDSVPDIVFAKLLYLDCLRYAGIQPDALCREKIIGHYTSLAALYGIFKGKPRSYSVELWGSDYTVLNDKGEGRWARAFLRQHSIDVEEEPDLSLMGIASWTGAIDSVPLWLAYGQHGRGVCIEINALKCVDLDDVLGGPVVYGEEDGAKFLSRYLEWREKFIGERTYFFGLVDQVIARFVKDQDFMFEDEYRMVQFSLEPKKSRRELHLLHGGAAIGGRFHLYQSIEFLKTPDTARSLSNAGAFWKKKGVLAYAWEDHSPGGTVQVRYGRGCSDIERRKFEVFLANCGLENVRVVQSERALG